MPQQTVAMATYPEGSLNAELGKRYREILARDGIDLRLEQSAGAVEAIARLKDSKSETGIALIPGGLTTEQDSPQLVSLGTLFYQPLWIFSRHRFVQRHGSPGTSEYQSVHKAAAHMPFRSGFSDRLASSIRNPPRCCHSRLRTRPRSSSVVRSILPFSSTDGKARRLSNSLIPKM